MRRFKAAAVAAMMALAALSTGASGDDISFAADSMSGSMRRGEGRVSLVGRAWVRAGAVTIRADRITLWGDDYRYVECSGAVTASDAERGLSLAADALYYDRRQKLMRLSGSASMEDAKNETVVKAEFIEYDDLKDLALAQIGARILKGEIAARAEFVRFDRAAETLELSGQPYVRRGGDEYRARRISVKLDTEAIRLEGAVSGTVLDRGGAAEGGGR